MQPFDFSYATSASGDTLVSRCLEQLGEIPPEASLGFIYAMDSLAGELPAIVERLQAELPGVHWTGTVGMGLCVNGQEIYDCPALALMIGSFPDDSFRILPRLRAEPGGLPAELSDWWSRQSSWFALLHGDPTSPVTASLLERVSGQHATGFINGGLTSSDGASPQVADGVRHGGLSGVLFGDQVRVLTGHSQGCTPIGPVHELTRASENIALTLDHRPAVDVLKEDIGEVLSRDLSAIGGYIFAALPITGTDDGDYLVRNLIGLDPDAGRVAIGDYLEDKPKLMFCQRDGNTAREDMNRMLERLRHQVGDAVIRGGVYISCLGRGRHQFGDDSEELRMIRDRLGDFPLVGFFANGEIYNGRLYGYTGVLTLFL